MVTEPKKNPLLEAVKEGARIAVFGAAAALLQWLADVIVPGLEPQYMVWTPVITFVLRLADKYVHEHKDIKWGGLVPF